jgi:hypothetical protein
MTWKTTNTAKGDNKLYSDAKGVVPSLDLRFAEGKNLNDYMTGQQLIQFSRPVGANQSPGTYVDENKIIQLSSADQPRFDHDPTTGESLGLLIEESRTNLVTYSEEFDNSGAWSSLNFTVTANQAQAPDGTSTADKFLGLAGTSLKLVGQNTTNSGTYTYSVYVKSSTQRYYQVSRSGNATDYVNFDIQALQRSLYGVTTGSIQYVGNGWYRLIATFPSLSNSSMFLSYADSLSFARQGSTDSTNESFIWGAQLEAGSFPTSYIPTTGTALTRSADVASITGSNFSSWYNQSEGTVYCNFLAPARGTGVSTYQVVSINDGTVNEHIGLARAFDPVQIEANVITGFSPQASFFIYPIPVGNQKIALTYKSNYSNLAASGILSSADTNLIVPNPTQLSIGQDSVYTTYGLNSTISRLTYFPERLPDATLQAITAP